MYRCCVCGQFDKSINLIFEGHSKSICEPNDLIDGIRYHAECKRKEVEKASTDIQCLHCEHDYKEMQGDWFRSKSGLTVWFCEGCQKDWTQR